MSCSCDYEAPEFYCRSTPTARKVHRCYECSGEIRPGERYERVSGKWDGEIGVYLTCERCFDIRQWVTNNVPCTCWAHGNLRGDAENAVEEAQWRAPQETVGLRFGLLRRFVQRDRFNAARRASPQHQEGAP